MINKDTYKRLTERDKNNGKPFIPYKDYRTDKKINGYDDGFFDLLNRLAELEDKIMNGTLIELPCKEGTTIYHLYKAGNVITEDKVFRYHFDICTKPCVSFENYFWYGTNKRVDTILVEHFGKYWFTDKDQAEARLKELQEKEQ